MTPTEQTKLQDRDESLVEVALFPIPGMVTFPGTTVPLHVFEPRYRRMIQDAVEKQRLVGVCHTAKEIRSAPGNQSPQEILTSNQATYDPCQVFSAGYCNIVSETEDGRIYLEVDMVGRYQLGDEIQTLPYRKYLCRALPDTEEEEQGGSTLEELKQHITAALIEIAGQRSDELSKLLSGEDWQQMPPAAFSFRLFNYIRIDPDIMQAVLESTSARDRLEILWGLFRGV